jgi:hypothetical protein
MGTSDTFIDLPIFDTYRIQKEVSKYRTSKVSEGRILDHQISTFDSPILSDTEKNIGTKNEKKWHCIHPFLQKNRHFHEEKSKPASSRKNRVSDTEKSIGCPSLLII